jgi:hypothetical protein
MFNQRSKVRKSEVITGPPERALFSSKMLRAAEPLATFDLPVFDF